MKKLLTVALALALVAVSALALADNVKLVIGATSTPHGEILEAAKPILAEKGIDIDIIIFDGYEQLNPQLQAGDLDANYFQHGAYLAEYNASNGDKLVSLGNVHYEPMGIYVNPAKEITLDAIPDGAVIIVPNDPSNEARALQLLQAQGILTLDEAAGGNATKLDVTDNPHNVEIVEAEAAQVPHQLADADLAVINSNFALEAGVEKVGTAIASESSDIAYPNIVAVRKDDDRSELQTLIEVLQSDEIVNFITETYGSAVIPTK